MPKKSVRGFAAEKSVQPHSRPAPDLERLRRAMKREANTGTDGLPSQSRRLVRGDDGKLPSKPGSAIRDALLSELGRRNMTRYELWKVAHTHCRTLSESAVYEFLRGQRAISVDYCEAMLKALNLGVTRLRRSA